jgi:hypothetical protein
MKKQSSRARAQSTPPPVRHQLDHVVPTVIHDPEENMTALGRWASHAMKEPQRYVGWPVALIGGAILAMVVWRLATGGSSNESEQWSKLELARTPTERLDLAKTNPKSPAASWAKLQAATEFLNQALVDLPNERDVSRQASKKALDLFDEIIREAPRDTPPARLAALGKARALEMRNELSRAIEQYELVAKEWRDTPEAEAASRYADALKDPQAAAFYKDLDAYTPPKVTLPPMGTEIVPPPGVGTIAPPAMKTGSAPSPPSDQPPALSPGLGIPGLREVIDTKGRIPAQPKPVAPDAKAQPAKPAGAQNPLPDEVFAPKTKESK